ncbi:MAG: LacI family DNA-binding transcriptional regulator [Cetobacterium sp.]
MNIKEIARLAGVSVATISRVLNNDPKVKDTTKEKVEQVMSEFNYKPNSHAVRLSKRIGDRIIGLIVPDVENVLFSEMIEVVSSCAAKEDVTILFFNTNGEYEKEKKVMNLLIDYRVKGIIYIPGKYDSSRSYSFLKKIEKNNIPTVFLDREIEGFNFDGVFLDNYRISYSMTTEILKNTKDKIYFISGLLDVSSGHERFLGFQKAIQDNLNSNIEFEVKYGNFKFDSGFKLGEEILKNHKGKELVVYLANNRMALGFLKALRKYTQKFERVIIGVFGISEVLDMLLDHENHITCKVPNKEIAEKSFEILLEKINNPNQRDEKRKKILYSSVIVNRIRLE